MSAPAVPERTPLEALPAGAQLLGETDLSEEAAGETAEVTAPLQGILQGVGSWLGGIVRVCKKPAALIGLALLAVLWIVLARNLDSDSGLVQFLSWFSFARGGVNRSLPGAVLGVLGRGAVAGAVVSLFTGGLKSLPRGIGALVKGHGEKRGAVFIGIGALVGAAVYFLWTGKHASAGTTMAGISGILLSLEALGEDGGRLQTLARSLTSRVSDGVRSEAQGNCDGLLTGLTAGFALSTVISLFL